MTNFTFAQINLRNMNKAKMLCASALGIEVTDALLAAICQYGNIDGQHGYDAPGFDNGSGYFESAPKQIAERQGKAAITIALEQYDAVAHMRATGAWVPYQIPPTQTPLVTIRPDLDSVGAMAILEMAKSRMQGGTGSYRELSESARAKIALIAKCDSFAMGEWLGPRSLPTRENRWPEMASVDGTRELAAIAAHVSDSSLSLESRVMGFIAWLTLEESEQTPYFLTRYQRRVEEQRDEMIAAIESGEIHIFSQPYPMPGHAPFIIVESTHRAALSLGYCFAPVVVARNPQTGKVTICQWREGYCDLDAVVAELDLEEAVATFRHDKVNPGRWGGSKTIKGSPQTEGTVVPLSMICDIVRKHLIA